VKTNGNDLTQEALRTALRRLVVATVVVYTALAGLGGYVYVNAVTQRASIARTVDSTTTALCALVNDLETRIQTSRAFLKENPDGIPGITPKIIRDGIKNQQRTIDALAPLKCPPIELSE
jgi:CHASE1-domain containing sensor protein